MKVIDLLSICSEEMTVVLLNWSTAEVLARYDGKNNIDVCFNIFPVEELDIVDNKLLVWIKY